MAKRADLSSYLFDPPSVKSPSAPSTHDPFAVPVGKVKTPVNRVQASLEACGAAVFNRQPRITSTAQRIAIVGDYASRDDEEAKAPFSGAVGRMLRNTLSAINVPIDACFIGNVIQHHVTDPDTIPSANDPVVQLGLAQLTKDLETFKPNIVVLLGRLPLMLAKGTTNMDAWRGSYFISEGELPFFGKKCIATYHPRDTFTVYERTPLVTFDLSKALKQSTSLYWEPPARDLRATNITATDIVASLNRLLADPRPISIDIEGWVDAMSCISVAVSPTDSFIIPFTRGENGNFYEFLEDEVAVWRALSRVLADPRIPKTLQNCLYDRFVLQYSYGVFIANIVDDTMLKHWELYCELEKSLAFLCSIYTDEPYYKSERGSADRETFWKYCCRDSAVTMEIAHKLDKFLTPAQKKHYQFNLELLNPMMYMELRGIKYDFALAAERLRDLLKLLYRTQYRLDTVAGFGEKITTPKSTLLRRAQETMCYKRDPQTPKLGPKGKGDVRANVRNYYSLLSWLTTDAPVTEENIGEFNIATKLGLNLRSPTFKDVVYHQLKLPIHYNEDGNETTDYEALLRLSKTTEHPLIKAALELGSLRTRAQMLRISADFDGRVRCGYNAVGTETGRITCYTSPTGSGYNLQTIPSKDPLRPEGHPLKNGMRDIFVADEGYYLFQCDLSGADGWTVAANLAALGDSTMLEDYRAGIKPAKVLCYLLRHGAASLHGKTRAEIKVLTGPISGKDWDYFACKIGQHGTCYLMGPKLLSEVIYIQSEGAINLSTAQTKDLQRLFSVRYKIKTLHDSMGSKLLKSPYLTSASGHRRRFFGRHTDLLGQALAHDPQANTTYATNMAMLALWKDPDNRIDPDSRIMQPPETFPLRWERNAARVPFRIEPLHQVHDALLGQFRIADTDWAKGRIKQYFNNPMTIAGVSLVIPFEGNYGPSWGNLDVGEIESC